jgi:cob(I)alamin adenosyltransferase
LRYGALSALSMRRSLCRRAEQQVQKEQQVHLLRQKLNRPKAA